MRNWGGLKTLKHRSIERIGNLLVVGIEENVAKRMSDSRKNSRWGVTPHVQIIHRVHAIIMEDFVAFMGERGKGKLEWSNRKFVPLNVCSATVELFFGQGMTSP